MKNGLYFSLQNAHKDGAIIKLQSQLDTIQQELDYSVEELTQKTDRLEQLDRLLLTLRDKNTTLTASQDESAKKVNSLFLIVIIFCLLFILKVFLKGPVGFQKTLEFNLGSEDCTTLDMLCLHYLIPFQFLVLLILEWKEGCEIKGTKKKGEIWKE